MVDWIDRPCIAPGHVAPSPDVLGWGLALLLLAAAVAPGLADAAERPALREQTGAAIRGPLGWERWCRENTEACARAAPATISLDRPIGLTLERVFHEVRDRITPVDEPPGQDEWRVVEGKGFGDCEDFALTWRAELLAAGLPAGALDIAVVETEQQEIHAVLAIHTDQGTLVFDNRHATPRPWASLPYHWLALEPVRGTAVAMPAAVWRSLPDHARIGANPPVTADGVAAKE